MPTLNATYFRWALLLLAAELAIGLYLYDTTIRPYGGDFLVVVLRYCLLRGLLPLRRGYAAGGALLLACAVEAGQYSHLLARLGWRHLRWARLLLGSHFTWVDILAYTHGRNRGSARGRVAGPQAAHLTSGKGRINQR